MKFERHSKLTRPLLLVLLSLAACTKAGTIEPTNPVPHDEDRTSVTIVRPGGNELIDCGRRPFDRC
jgi:hypothetical protein